MRKQKQKQNPPPTTYPVSVLTSTLPQKSIPKVPTDANGDPILTKGQAFINSLLAAPQTRALSDPNAPIPLGNPVDIPNGPYATPLMQNDPMSWLTGQPNVPVPPAQTQTMGPGLVDQFNTENRAAQEAQVPDYQVQADLASHLAKFSKARAEILKNPAYGFTPQEQAPNTPFPTMQHAQIPDRPMAQANPWATLLGAIGGFASPAHAGNFAAAPIHAAFANADQEHQDMMRKYQLLEQKAHQDYANAIGKRADDINYANETNAIKYHNAEQLRQHLLSNNLAMNDAGSAQGKADILGGYAKKGDIAKEHALNAQDLASKIAAINANNQGIAASNDAATKRAQALNDKGIQYQLDSLTGMSDYLGKVDLQSRKGAIDLANTDLQGKITAANNYNDRVLQHKFAVSDNEEANRIAKEAETTKFEHAKDLTAYKSSFDMDPGDSHTLKSLGDRLDASQTRLTNATKSIIAKPDLVHTSQLEVEANQNSLNAAIEQINKKQQLKFKAKQPPPKPKPVKGAPGVVRNW